MSHDAQVTKAIASQDDQGHLRAAMRLHQLRLVVGVPRRTRAPRIERSSPLQRGASRAVSQTAVYKRLVATKPTQKVLAELAEELRISVDRDRRRRDSPQALDNAARLAATAHKRYPGFPVDEPAGSLLMLMAQASESKNRDLGGYELPGPEVIHPNGRNYRPTTNDLTKHEAIREALRAVGAPLGPAPQPRNSGTSLPHQTAAIHVPGFDDAAAEAAETEPTLVAAMQARIEAGDFSVPDATATTKTRGSAQRVFSNIVKANYGYRCAITGIATKELLIAAHIVPWSADETVRLDPSNGICLSPLVDRAYELGYLTIDEECIVRINRLLISGDDALTGTLEAYDGTALAAPTASPPNPSYLRRRLPSYQP
jgi:HNH endonuclease